MRHTRSIAVGYRTDGMHQCGFVKRRPPQVLKVRSTADEITIFECSISTAVGYRTDGMPHGDLVKRGPPKVLRVRTTTEKITIF